jgi:hypothetical protein
MTVLVERRDSVYICTIRKKEEKQTLTPPTGKYTALNVAGPLALVPFKFALANLLHL